MKYAPVIVRRNIQRKITIEYREKQLEYVILKQQPKAEIVTSKQLNLRVDQILKERLHYPNKAHTPKPDHPWKRSFRCLQTYQPTTL